MVCFLLSTGGEAGARFFALKLFSLLMKKLFSLSGFILIAVISFSKGPEETERVDTGHALSRQLFSS